MWRGQVSPNGTQQAGGSMRFTRRAAVLVLVVGQITRSGVGPAGMGAPLADPVPELVRALGDSDAGTRWDAILKLGDLRSRAKGAVPRLVDLLLNDPDEEARNLAGYALIKIGPAAELPLIRALSSKYAEQRAWAVLVLGRLDAGRKGGPAVAPLRKLLDDTDPEVRVEAVQALARIGDAASVGEIVKMMKNDPNEGVRFVVIEALGDFGAEGAPAVGASHR